MKKLVPLIMKYNVNGSFFFCIKKIVYLEQTEDAPLLLTVDAADEKLSAASL